MKVGELIQALHKVPRDADVYLQDLDDHLLSVHPCLGEANEGLIVVIMARHAASASLQDKSEGEG